MNLNNVNGIQLFSVNDLKALMGHDWSDSCSAAAMNGDYDPQNAQVTSVDYAGGLNARFDRLVGGGMRINWLIVDSTNAGE